MQVGERLKAIRESKNMSQGDIEKKTGLLRCYVSRCENQWTVPNLTTLEKWSAALGVSLSELFADNGKPAKPLAALQNGHTPKLNKAAANGLHRIQSAFAKMDGRDIAIVVGVAQKLAGAK